MMPANAASGRCEIVCLHVTLPSGRAIVSKDGSAGLRLSD